ncbi:hypothetical protein KY285_003805 [Solanum tuberosum]|nr:hypothetical protein KY285_003805 [Solanum tuberosum]
MKVPPTDKEGTMSESSPKVSPSDDEEKATREISSIMSPSSSENPIEPSSQEAHYLECGIERKIVADDNPFTEVETHFGDTKFFLKGYIVKGKNYNDVKSIKPDKLTSKRIDEAVGKEKVDTKQLFPILNKRKIMSSNNKLTSGLHYVPKIDAINLALEVLGKSIAQNQVRDVALPTKRTREGFDPNAYKLFVKAVYNSNEPSMLGKLPSEDTTRQAREGLGYSQPPPIRIYIRRESNNHITFEDEVTTPNKKPFVFDRLGESTARTFVFERLGPLNKKNNKNMRSYLK